MEGTQVNRRDVARSGREILERGSLRDVVETLRAMPYERPSVRDVPTTLAEWRGTCSTKHALLRDVIERRWPEFEPQTVHRIYRIGHGAAFALYGPEVADTVPRGGLTDVHRYVTIDQGGGRIDLDVTFATGVPWDGRSSMMLAAGDGDDIIAGADPDADKQRLELEHVDPAVREPFITALTHVARRVADDAANPPEEPDDADTD